MADWWIVHNRESGIQVSESSTDPTDHLPDHLAAVKVPERPNYETHEWDPVGIALVEKPKPPAVTVSIRHKFGSNAAESHVLPYRATVYYTLTVYPGPVGGKYPDPPKGKVLIPVAQFDVDGEVTDRAAFWIHADFKDGVADGQFVLASDMHGRYGFDGGIINGWQFPERTFTVVL